MSSTPPTGGTPEPSFNDAFEAAVKNSSLGKVSTADQPTGAAILAAIGGIRGLIESILPSFVFLVVFLITKDVWLSALVPLVVAILFIVIRVIMKAPVTPAVTGAVGVGITAFLAIVTNRAENNFIPGILLNSVFLLAMVISLVVRRPLIGVFVAVLLGEEASDWRSVPRQRRLLTLATWIWAGLFAVRLAVEVPLYLAQNAAALAVAKLILGVPLYAVVLWVTWLLVRAVFPPKPKVVENESADPNGVDPNSVDPNSGGAPKVS